jgi:hypothetical protein
MARRAKAARRRFIFIRYLGVGFVALFMTSHLAIAQNDDSKLLDVIVAAPKLNLQRAEFSFQPALAATSTEVLRSVSCVAVDRRGYVFVIQRGVPNPIIVADSAGKVVASWGENLFKIPHTIPARDYRSTWRTEQADGPAMWRQLSPAAYMPPHQVCAAVGRLFVFAGVIELVVIVLFIPQMNAISIRECGVFPGFESRKALGYGHDGALYAQLT